MGRVSASEAGKHETARAQGSEEADAASLSPEGQQGGRRSETGMKAPGSVWLHDYWCPEAE